MLWQAAPLPLLGLSFGWSAVPLAIPQDPAGVAAALVSRDKISQVDVPFPDGLAAGDAFGTAVVSLGDLDGDGVAEVAVGAPGDESGAVRILFLDPDGALREHAKIHAGVEGFAADVVPGDGFGSSLAILGDLDGNGMVDLAVGAPGDDDGGDGEDRGAVWILFLHPDGSVKAHTKVSATKGDFGGLLRSGDAFGEALASVADLDGDGIRELAVGAPGDDDGAFGNNDRGAVWVLFLEANGRVRSERKLSSGTGEVGALDNGGRFGSALADLGDLDGDGIVDLAAGARFDDLQGPNVGAVWALFLRSDGSVRAFRKTTANSLSNPSDHAVLLGSSLTAIGDLDGDGTVDLAAGEPADSNGTFGVGAARILFLRDDGTVASHVKIDDTTPGFTGTLAQNGEFGRSIAALPDVNGDGVVDLLVGNPRDRTDEHGVVGATWVLFLERDGAVRASRKLGIGVSGIPPRDGFRSIGSSVRALGDVDGNGFVDFAVGSRVDGVVWILLSGPDGSVDSFTKFDIADVTGDVRHKGFGAALEVLEDLDGDGIRELAVGAPSQLGENASIGEVWILFLGADGAVRDQRLISDGQGGLLGAVDAFDLFGAALASPGDLDGDGTIELVVGAPGGDDLRGELWVLSLDATGTVVNEARIESDLGPPVLLLFGSSLAALGDVDGDGIGDLAVTEQGFESSFSRVHVLFLNADGTVRARQEIREGVGGFGGDLDDFDGFGFGLAPLGDLDGNGVVDLAAGAPRDDFRGPFSNEGAVWLLFLNADGTVRDERKIDAAGSLAGELDAEDRFGWSLASLGDLDGDGLRDLGVGTPGDDDGGAMWIVQPDGVATFAFEEGDDLEATPLVNGGAVSQAPLGRTIEIRSEGANLGAAIFDATPGGPNDPGVAPGLLVGGGNLLLLQDPAHADESSPGVFAQPAPAPEGGTLTLSFRGPIEPREIALVGFGTETSARFTLLDAHGRRRVLTVPSGWTGDLAIDGPPGRGVLDLTTLAPQPGFASTVEASQDTGFRAETVVELRITLQGPGALDDLRWIPHPAAERKRTGGRLR